MNMNKKRLLRRLTRDTTAGITVYVLILFGMSIMLYFFGFTSMWTDYQKDAKVNETNITDPTYQQNQNSNPLYMLVNLLQKNTLIFGVGLASIVAVAILGWFTRADLSAFYQYIIPIGILAIFLNTVVFPIYPLSNELAKYEIGGVPVSIFLIVFFNLWFLLAIIEYVRSGVTS